MTSRVAVSSAAWAALPPERSIGNWPTPVKNHFLSRPLKPGSVKYSDLAGKVTLRLTRSGMKNESATARWLPARIAPPVSGMFSAPTTLVGHSVLSSGPMNTHFMSQYSTGASVLHRSSAPVTRVDQTTKPGGLRTTATTRIPAGQRSISQRITGPGGPPQRPRPVRAWTVYTAHTEGDRMGVLMRRGTVRPHRFGRDRVPALPRVHRYPREHAGLGGPPRRGRVHRALPAAAGPRHPLARPQPHDVAGLVRRDPRSAPRAAVDV